jgi:5'-3' exonuclease
MKNYIIIDASYFILYRYHALKAWWGFSNQEEELGEFPHKNINFMNKFTQTFGEKLNEMIKKFKINHKDQSNKIYYIIAKDCPRKNIWRNDIYDLYKSNREKRDESITFIFNYVFENYLFMIKNKYIYDIKIVDFERLEADDCVSLISRNINKKYENKLGEYMIYIIASDIDYLQICSNNTNLYNLKYNKINNNDSNETSTNSEFELFIKIVIGDKSDNITGIFNKCGKKTALKYYNDKDVFERKLNESEIYKTTYERNKTLIDFNCIPKIYSDGFNKKYFDFLSSL